MIIRSQKYYIKQLSEDGLLKDPLNRWGETEFDAWGYNSEEDAWADIENRAKSDWEGSKHKLNWSFVVICKWTVSYAD